MGVLDRIILTLYTFSLILISVAFIVIALGFRAPLDFIGTSLETASGRWTVGLLGAVFLTVSLRLFILAFRRQGGGQAVVHENALGQVRISLGAVEEIVKRVARQVRGIRDIRAAISAAPAGIIVHLRAAVAPDISIPDVSAEVQDAVKRQVRNVVGVDVAEVRVQVDQIAGEAKRGRVE